VLPGSDRDAIAAAAEALETASMSFAERRMDRGIRSALAGVSVDTLAAKVDRAEGRG
jgi:molecular chaperone HscA